MTRNTICLFALVCLVLASACDGGDNDERPRLLVAAAADLRFAFEELRPLFLEQCDCDLEFSFGSSGNFATQIEQGLPADVFFSANVAFVERLEAGGHILPETKQLYAVGRIVLAKHNSVGEELDDLEDLLEPAFRRVSIANPDHAPYGVAAQEAMTAAGVWEEVRSRLVLGENASQATQFVESGDAQAGIVPLSLAIRLEASLSYVLIEESMHTQMNQATAVLTRSENPELALSFIEFVNSDEGRELMARYGFEAPH
jgi:molybdate transport system substrate-binding protein